MTTAKIFDGKDFAKKWLSMLDVEGQTLAIVRVGSNAASTKYINNKIKAAKQVKANVNLIEFPETVTEDALLDTIYHLNADSNTDGIIVQLPLPSHISEEKIANAISTEKDVDGFNKDSAFKPCTPLGIMMMLDCYKINLTDKNVVIIGRSNIVGKPLAKMMLERNANVTVLHSHTSWLNKVEACKRADIIVAAAGQRHLVERYMVKYGAILIDVGINFDENGKMCGDIAEECAEVASFITPVPGGIGRLTVAALMNNLALTKEIKKHKESDKL